MRLFIAATFPTSATAPIAERLSRVRTRLPPASWVRPESQHLTFAFIGEQPESVLAKLTAPVAASVATVRKFEARVSNCGFFPNPRHARVGWAGVAPEQMFRHVADAVRSALKAASVEFDQNEFRPHLTVMRIRDRWPPACIQTFCTALEDYESAPFVVDHVTLFSSELNPQGAIHSPLAQFALT
jgi:2'-5' RNA ligase